MSYPYVVKPPPRMIFGHPGGLYNLFFTEMWERFSFYGMRAILILFLVDATANDGLGLAPVTAAALYSVYNATVYLLAMPGGWVADRLTGTHRAALALRYLDGLPVAQVARALDRTVTATEALLVRARAAFRRSYTALGEGGNR
jgi:hypothetical protein